MIQRLKKIKINKSGFFISLVGVIIFIEILIASPQVLEKEDIDSAEPSSALKEASDTGTAKGIEQKMQGVHFVENGKNDGKSEKGWELFAREANGSTEGQWVLKTVKVQFYNNNLSNYTVTGDHGEVDSITKDILITGHVVTTSSNGYSFKTNTIRYMAKQKLMTSVDQVLMLGPADSSGPGFDLTGEKLLVDMAKGKMSILDQVVAHKVINAKPFKLTSVRADFSNKNQEATFSGHVQMRLGTMQALAPFALFQYSNQRKTLEKIIMNDDVEFTDIDKKGYCKEIEFDLINNQMTMRGQPKVLQGEDEIKGHEIVFLDGGKKVKINKAPQQGIKK